MLAFLLLWILFISAIAQDFKSLDDENAFLVVATKDILSHEEARAKCKALDSDLAVIKSPQTLDFVLELIRESEYTGKQWSTLFCARFLNMFRKEKQQEKKGISYVHFSVYDTCSIL